MTSRREFLGHAGALGLGLAFQPHLATVAKAGVDHRDITVTGQRSGIIFEKIEAGGLAHYSYFLGDTLSGVAAVIDPKRDVEDYVDLACRHRLQITHAIETHVHADFVSGARELAARSGARIYASVEGDTRYGFSIEPLRHGTTLKVGGIRLRTLHTPGHTPEHVSFLATYRGSPEKSWALFTGDFLFAGSVGRPDLMGVENTDNLARSLFNSLQNAFVELPDKLPIYPAHGPGSPCGANIVERDEQATLGIERRSNPAMQFDDRRKFIEDLLFHQPPVPYYWPRMKKINARGPRILGGVSEPEPLEPKAFRSMLERTQPQLLDTRNFMAFGGGHIHGALNIGHSPSVSMWGGWLIDPDRPVALVVPPEVAESAAWSRGGWACGPLPSVPPGGAANEVVAWLNRIGVTDVTTVLDGGMKAWTIEGFDFQTLPQLSVHALKKRVDRRDIQVVDVRYPAEWDEGHLPGAQYMFLPEIPDRLGELDRNRPVAAYCGTGYRSSIAASLLQIGGLNAHSVPGSFPGWKNAGYAITQPGKPKRASDTRRA